MRNSDIAYLTGFFDGEGSVMLSLNQSAGLQVSIACSQNTRTVLDMYVKAFGGHVYGHKPKNRNSEMFQWRANGDVAIKALMRMAPYLLVKALSANEAFVAWGQRLNKDVVAELVEAHRTRVHEEREAR